MTIQNSSSAQKLSLYLMENFRNFYYKTFKVLWRIVSVYLLTHATRRLYIK